MSERVLNFLANWIDANIVHPSASPEADALERSFLADAVASGIPLDDVNAAWDTVTAEIASALDRWRRAHDIRAS